jgi:hypothetical protein
MVFRMYNSGIQGVRVEPEILSGVPVPFWFALSWLYLTRPEGRMPPIAPCYSLALILYGVVRGTEDPHIQIALPEVSGAGLLNVRLEVKGSPLTICLQDHVVPDWENHRLKSGGVGYLSEREEQGLPGSVRTSFHKAGVSQ